MNFVKIKNIFKIILILFIVYAIYTFINQQTKLNQYNQEIKTYQEQISSLNNQKQELETTKENMNSPEFIENIARDSLDMYRPNERVYIDVSK